MPRQTYRRETKEERLTRLADDWIKFKEKQKTTPYEKPPWKKEIGLEVHHNKFLPMFWTKFRNMRTPEGKLALLREMADLWLPTDIPYKQRRGFKFKRRRRKWICGVCKGKATHVHHIIQLQHGGRNKKGNMIELCRPCHEAIHPWMVKPLGMKETMDRVAREA